MSRVKELKRIADENDIYYEKQHSEKKMEEILTEAGLLEPNEEKPVQEAKPAPKKSNSQLFERFKAVASSYSTAKAVKLDAQLGDKYRFKTYFDESRGKDVYVTYIDVVQEPEDQISPQLASKIRRGFHPEPEDYLPPKTIIKRVALIDSEWRRYFKESAI